MSIKLPDNFLTNGGLTTRDGASRGLYSSEFEKDSCGVGFVAHVKGERSHQIVADADLIACSMDHRGARNDKT